MRTIVVSSRGSLVIAEQQTEKPGRTYSNLNGKGHNSPVDSASQVRFVRAIITAPLIRIGRWAWTYEPPWKWEGTLKAQAQSSGPNRQVCRCVCRWRRISIHVRKHWRTQRYIIERSRERWTKETIIWRSQYIRLFFQRYCQTWCNTIRRYWIDT